MDSDSRILLSSYLSVSNALHEYRLVPALPFPELPFLPLSEGLDSSLPAKVDRF